MRDEHEREFALVKYIVFEITYFGLQLTTTNQLLRPLTSLLRSKIFWPHCACKIQKNITIFSFSCAVQGIKQPIPNSLILLLFVWSELLAGFCELFVLISSKQIFFPDLEFVVYLWHQLVELQLAWIVLTSKIQVFPLLLHQLQVALTQSTNVIHVSEIMVWFRIFFKYSTCTVHCVKKSRIFINSCGVCSDGLKSWFTFNI